MSNDRWIGAAVIAVASAAVLTAQAATRTLNLDDLARLKDVRDPQCSPDGRSVAFVVSAIDVKEDKSNVSHVWTVGIDGQNERQVTASQDSESNPKFSQTVDICRSRRRAQAKRRAIRCGCSTGAAARRFSSPT